MYLKCKQVDVFESITWKPKVQFCDDLKRITTEIVQRWGLPEDVDPQDMIACGLMSAEGLDPSKPRPRWDSTPSLHAVT